MICVQKVDNCLFIYAKCRSKNQLLDTPDYVCIQLGEDSLKGYKRTFDLVNSIPIRERPFYLAYIDQFMYVRFFKEMVTVELDTVKVTDKKTGTDIYLKEISFAGRFNDVTVIVPAEPYYTCVFLEIGIKDEDAPLTISLAKLTDLLNYL